MPRYALKIEYDGGPYSGWQRQAELPTVQGRIEAALARLEADLPSIAVAGRTDTGVHALGQVAHCDMLKEWEAFKLAGALNYHLKPDPIAIVDCAPVPDDWHARFSAQERRYLFRLVTRRAPVVHDRGHVWQVSHELELEPMRRAASFWLGKHDFTTFRSAECQADSPIRTLDRLEITQHPYPGGTEYRFDVRARSFLHNQVRSFVGTLERVGAGAWTPEDCKAALEARDRARCGPVCPGTGLYLAHVDYPSDPFAALE